MDLSFKIIEKKDILQIIPLLSVLNTKTPADILEKRVFEMVNYPNYECAAMFANDKLIGISGLWYSTRHYIGKSVEPDHVIISKEYRGQKLGEKFFEWIEKHTTSKGCEALELNTYVNNKKSHKFYYNQGYEILGFHFLKISRDDKNFY